MSSSQVHLHTYTQKHTDPQRRAVTGLAAQLKFRLTKLEEQQVMEQLH